MPATADLANRDPMMEFHLGRCSRILSQVNLPVTLQDERMSTQVARRKLETKEKVFGDDEQSALENQIAAAVVLQVSFRRQARVNGTSRIVNTGGIGSELSRPSLLDGRGCDSSRSYGRRKHDE